MNSDTVPPITLLFIAFCVVVAIIAYFIPAGVAHRRAVRNSGAIIVLNLLAGWTIVGWIVALMWAMTSESQNVQVYRTNPMIKHQYRY